MPDVTFSSNGSETPGYLATPPSATGPGVVVLQEWWGLDDHIRSICDRLAGDGFFALAPDLYRKEPTTQPDEAQQMMMAMDMERAVKDMRGAADYVHAQPGVQGERVGALGFCLGGGLAMWAAASSPLIGATVSYYYVMPHGRPDFSQVAGPVLGHFGTSDDFIPIADAQALERDISDAGVAVDFEYYEGGGHAFFNDTNRLGTYDPQLAASSWERTTAFLHEHLDA